MTYCIVLRKKGERDPIVLHHETLEQFHTALAELEQAHYRGEVTIMGLEVYEKRGETGDQNH